MCRNVVDVLKLDVIKTEICMNLYLITCDLVTLFQCLWTQIRTWFVVLNAWLTNRIKSQIPRLTWKLSYSCSPLNAIYRTKFPTQMRNWNTRFIGATGYNNGWRKAYSTFLPVLLWGLTIARSRDRCSVERAWCQVLVLATRRKEQDTEVNTLGILSNQSHLEIPMSKFFTFFKTAWG